jgi:hypothetical protein
MMVTCEGTIHQKFVPPSQTVNQHNNRQVLELGSSKSAHNVPNDSETKDWLIHRDNAQAHTALSARQFLDVTRGCDSTPFLLE